MRDKKKQLQIGFSLFFGAVFAFLVWGIDSSIYTSAISWFVSTGIFALQLSALFARRKWPMQQATRQSFAARLTQWFLQCWFSPAMIFCAFSIIGVFSLPASLGTALIMTFFPSMYYLGLYVDLRKLPF